MKFNIVVSYINISFLVIALTLSNEVNGSKVLFKRHNSKTNKTQASTTEGPDTDNHGFVDLDTSHQEHFNEAELERLCPSNDIQVLKTMLATHINCSTQNNDYWHDQCLCYYEKKIPCPKCPESSSTSLPPTSNNFMNFVITNNKTGSTNVTNPNNATKSCINESKNSSSSGSQFNLYNSGGGIINLYFYLNGQTQLQNTTAKPNNGTNVTTTVAPKGKNLTTKRIQ